MLDIASRIVSVEPLQPTMWALFDKVKDFQTKVRNSTGSETDRELIFNRLECWLIELKMLSLTAYQYKEQHDFYDKLCWNGFLKESRFVPNPRPLASASFREQSRDDRLRREIEAFHWYASILLDGIPRFSRPTSASRGPSVRS